MTRQVSGIESRLRRWLMIEPGEWVSVGMCFGYFFFLLAGYFVLRPLRETAAIKDGTGALPWLYSSVFIIMLLIVPLFGWLVAKVPKRIFLPAVYLFFIACLLGFSTAFGGQDYSRWAAGGFYIWLSVFNLFVVSVFWSFMVDLFDQSQAKRVFPVIAAGGSLGAICGPLLTSQLVDQLGLQALMWLAAGLLSLALLCQLLLLGQVQEDAEHHVAQPIGGSVVAGATAVATDRYLRGIALMLFFLPVMNTFLYFIQGELVFANYVDDAARATFFARVDFWANVIAFICPLLLTGRLLRWLGVAPTLMVMPLLTAVGFVAMAFAPSILMLTIVQAIRRGGEYGLMKPARKLLWTSVDEESKYKAQNFVDTAVYRGGDVATGWIYAGLAAVLGSGVSMIAALVAPLAACWAWVAYRMGQQFEQR